LRWDFAGRGLDCHHWKPRLAHADFVRRGHLVGRGFDVLYACQDIEFDKQAGLFSVPSASASPPR